MWTKAEIATFYDVSVQAVDAWLRRGCPRIKRGNRTHFMPGSVQMWRRKQGTFKDQAAFDMYDTALMGARIATHTDKECLAVLKRAGVADPKHVLAEIRVAEWKMVAAAFGCPNEAMPGRAVYREGEEDEAA